MEGDGTYMIQLHGRAYSVVYCSIVLVVWPVKLERTECIAFVLQLSCEHFANQGMMIPMQYYVIVTLIGVVENECLITNSFIN